MRKQPGNNYQARSVTIGVTFSLKPFFLYGNGKNRGKRRTFRAVEFYFESVFPLSSFWDFSLNFLYGILLASVVNYKVENVYKEDVIKVLKSHALGGSSRNTRHNIIIIHFIFG